MSEEIKELFNKYGVKNLKDKHGQSECYFCKNIKHRYSLTWTSFLYEYKEHYYCYDCLLSILLQQENSQLKEKLNGVYEERDYLFNKLNIENKYLQQRIEKAIEYIGGYYLVMEAPEIHRLEEILKGDDTNE